MSLDEMEKRAIAQALEQAGNNQVRAAKLLGISRDTLRYRMKKFGLLEDAQHL
jgi:DNA-binding protein Fis